MPIDHILIATADFASSVARLRDDFGLEAVEGGRHPAWGTANWVVPLGGGYLELVGIADPVAAAASSFGRRTAEAIGAGGGPYAWCLRPLDFDRTAERLDLAVTPGSRVRPDGRVLRWRLAGVDVAMTDPSRPFFIAWDVPPSMHPGRAGPWVDAGRPELAWIEVGGEPEGLRSWLGREEPEVRVESGEPAVPAFGIARAGREIRIRARQLRTPPSRPMAARRDRTAR